MVYLKNYYKCLKAPLNTKIITIQCISQLGESMIFDIYAFGDIYINLNIDHNIVFSHHFLNDLHIYDSSKTGHERNLLL